MLVGVGLGALLVGTVVTVIAHFVAGWLGLSETTLVVAYVGTFGIGTPLFVGISVSNDLQVGTMLSAMDWLRKTGDWEAESAATPGPAASRPRHRRRKPRRG